MAETMAFHHLATWILAHLADAQAYAEEVGQHVVAILLATSLIYLGRCMLAR